MKVGSLFAEIGFKVNDKSLEAFTKAMKNVQDQIKSGLDNLKEYSKVANEIAKSVRGITSQTTTQKTISKQKIVIQKNIEAVKNTSQRSQNRVGRDHPLLKAFSSVNFHSLFQGVGRILGSVIGGAYGGVVGGYIGKIADKIIGAMFRVASWLGKTIVAGMRFGMAYRDYRNFTGRSTTSLGGLMKGTFNTQNMRPEDVLRDAASLETQYWDMILGGGNPALWQLLGLHPTGTGEVDLQNIVGRIGSITGNFEKRGLARALFKMAGLDENYLNIALYKSGQEKPVFEEQINQLLANAKAFEQTNKALREFEWIFNKFKSDILVAFVNSRAFEKLKQIIINLIENFDGLKNRIEQFFGIIGNFMDWLQREWPDIFGNSKKTSASERVLNRAYHAQENGEFMPWWAVKEAGLHPIDMTKFIAETIWDAVGDMMIAGKNYSTMNNTFNVGSTEEAYQIVNGIQRGPWSAFSDQQQKNDSFQSSYRGAF